MMALMDSLVPFLCVVRSVSELSLSHRGVLGDMAG